MEKNVDEAEYMMGFCWKTNYLAKWISTFVAKNQHHKYVALFRKFMCLCWFI